MEFGEVEPPTRRGILIVVLIALSLLSLLSIFDQAGAFGRAVFQILKAIFGWGFWIFPLILLLASYFALFPHKNFFKGANWVGMALTVMGYSAIFHLVREPKMIDEALERGIGGGYFGYAVLWPFLQIMGRWGSLVVMIAMLTVGVLLLFNTTLENLIERITLKNLRQRVREFFHYRRLKKIEKRMEEMGESPVVDFQEREVPDVEEGQEEVVDKAKEEVGTEAGEIENQTLEEGGEGAETKKERKKYPPVVLPMNLLDGKEGKPTARDIVFCQEKIKKTLSHFGIEVEMAGYAIGPTVTQYTFRPADGVKLSRILALSNDLALSLAAHPIRIEAPIPGKSLVGVEVPNSKIAIVPLRKVLESQAFKERKSNMTIVLGQDVAGNACMTDLTKLPHLLVAGTTGSGKTVGLNAMILSLLYQNQPDELKFILVDPKRVEMLSYEGIPYLLSPVVTEVKKTINALRWTISEMERRFHVLSNAGKRNIQSYNQSYPADKLPYIVFIIDELATLMSASGPEVEAAIIRLAQMSRAVGIHLILATQRPSVDIITGVIKANIPGRIAFSVASLTDSRTILDSSGAEKLMGRGDMLYTSAELSKPKRIQGAFCSDSDIENVTAHLRKIGDPDYVDEVTEKQQTLGLGGIVLNGDDDGEEDRLEEARDIIINDRKASASYLQRKMKIGYARAARILDLLEQQGVVGPADGAKPREILIKTGERDIAGEYIEQASARELKHENNRLLEDGQVGKIEQEDDYSGEGSEEEIEEQELAAEELEEKEEISDSEESEEIEEEAGTKENKTDENKYNF